MSDILAQIVSGVASGATSPATSLVNAARGILSMFKLDPNKKAEIEAQLTAENIDLQKAQMAQDLALAQAQAETNKIEAASANWFVAGWRPFIGWVCGVSLVYDLFLQPLAQFTLTAFHVALAPLPKLDTASVLALLIPMLGLGVMRTTEKLADAAGNH